jgi:hypothetical protein
VCVSAPVDAHARGIGWIPEVTAIQPEVKDCPVDSNHSNRGGNRKKRPSDSQLAQTQRPQKVELFLDTEGPSQYKGRDRNRPERDSQVECVGQIVRKRVVDQYEFRPIEQVAREEHQDQRRQKSGLQPEGTPDVETVKPDRAIAVDLG